MGTTAHSTVLGRQNMQANCWPLLYADLGFISRVNEQVPARAEASAAVQAPEIDDRRCRMKGRR